MDWFYWILLIIGAIFCFVFWWKIETSPKYAPPEVDKRFKQTLHFTGSAEKHQKLLNDFLVSHGYLPTRYSEEKVYMQGNGIMVAAKIIKLSFTADSVQIEAFVKVLIKDKESKEDALEGSWCAWSKKKLKATIISLVTFLEQNR